MKTNRSALVRHLSEASKRALVSLLVSAFVVALAGCASDKEKAPRTAGQTIDDQALTDRVVEALSSDPAYKFGDIKVVTYAGRVQLSGFVDRDEQKAKAEQIARRVPGVREVRNHIVKK